MLRTKVNTPLGIVYATYQGGAYIDLSSGKPDNPIEVINVFDDVEGKPRIEPLEVAFSCTLGEWLGDLEASELKTYFEQ